MLGHGFAAVYKKGVKGQYQLVVWKKAWGKLKRKLKDISRKTRPMSITERFQKLSEVWKGWVNNFRLANISAKLKALDEWLRNRLRYCIWHDWKKPERKRKNLIRLGMDHDRAYAYSRTRMGGWAVAQSPILKLLSHYPDLDGEGTNRCFPITIKLNLKFSEPPYTRPVRTVV